MIVVPEVDRPEVSVVIVTYGQAEMVRQTLEALVERTPPVYELIVVDNDSPDGTGNWLEANVLGASIIRLSANVGFGCGANRGAMSARGQYLCFLNSDAIVHDGWLPPLIRRLEIDRRVAGAIPRILNVDGTLQEAGSLVGRDGSTLALGYGDDPDRPPYRFSRVVDYGSAACLLIRRSAFTRAGGFDPAYGIGYYEDVDLAFGLDEGGQPSVYEPRSTVSHLRHGSSSVAEAEAFVLANRGKLVSRWAHLLACRPELAEGPRFPHRAVAARDAPSSDTVLVVEDRVPHADRGSGDPRSAALLQQLAQLWPHLRVTLLAVDGTNANRYAPDLWDAGIEVVWWEQDWEAWLEARRFHYSVVVVSRPNNHERFDAALGRTQPQALRVYDAEALYFRRLERQAACAEAADARDSLLAEAQRFRSLEASAAQAADVVLCVSEEERRVLEALAPDTKAVVLCHPVHPNPRPAGFDQRRGMLFFGGFMAGPGSPNEDGVLFAAGQLLPRLRALDPTIRLDVVGADPTEAVLSLAGDTVRVVGAVDDPRPWLDSARVHLAPLRYGAGIKLKLLDSLAAGLPFVTTPVGAEGLGLGRLNRHLVGEDPTELAHLAWSLYTDGELWTDVQGQLLELASRFGLPAFRARLVDAMASVGLVPPGWPNPPPRAEASVAGPAG